MHIVKLQKMSTAPPAPPNLDRYVVIHVATTCDEHGVYVTKDSAEVIELGWILLDAKNCDEVRSVMMRKVLYTLRILTDDISVQLHRESTLVKPINTPITPLCSKCQTFCTQAINRKRLQIYSAPVLNLLLTIYSEPDNSYMGTCPKRGHFPRCHQPLRRLCL
jgi:hypothetical protein